MPAHADDPTYAHHDVRYLTDADLPLYSFAGIRPTPSERAHGAFELRTRVSADLDARCAAVHSA